MLDKLEGSAMGDKYDEKRNKRNKTSQASKTSKTRKTSLFLLIKKSIPIVIRYGIPVGQVGTSDGLGFKTCQRNKTSQASESEN